VDWRDRAACKQKGVEPFFAAKSTLEGRRAVTLCLLCPVSGECLADALDVESTDASRVGIRGGMGPAERAVLARKLRAV
jgi:hypothetical protein